MPYIPQSDRTKLDAFADGLARNCDNVGELTYALSRLTQAYLAKDQRSYSTLSVGIAALECAKLELYRAVIGPYEAGKRKDNGDVMECACQHPLDCENYEYGCKVRAALHEADTTDKGW